MRLVFDSEALTSVTLVLGSVELPLSREQVVEMLFGGSYKIVPTGAPSVHVVHEKKKRGQQVALLPAADTQRSTVMRDAIISVLSNTPGATLHEIRAALEQRVPEAIAGQPARITKTLWNLVRGGTLLREGEPPNSRYRIAGETQTIATKDAVRERARARLQKLIKQGLCTRCGERKAAPGKKLCQTHLNETREQLKAARAELNRSVKESTVVS